MRPVRSLNDSFFFMGRWIPVLIGVLVGITLVLTIVAAVGTRNGFPLADQLALVPSLVWAGQLWRLVTWVFLELNFLALVFGCLALWWCGADLLSIWGPRRFIAVYLGIAAAAAAVTSLIALASPNVARLYYAGMWPVIDALLIAWALYFPSRQIFMYFVIPLNGRNFVWAILGATVLLALLNGVVLYIPHFLAELFMLAYLRDPSIARLWRRMVPTRAPRRPAHLREVKREKRWGEREPPRWYH
jgi:membrane associated rhomboid family serine protease